MIFGFIQPEQRCWCSCLSALYNLIAWVENRLNVWPNMLLQFGKQTKSRQSPIQTQINTCPRERTKTAATWCCTQFNICLFARLIQLLFLLNKKLFCPETLTWLLQEFSGGCLCFFKLLWRFQRLLTSWPVLYMLRELCVLINMNE